jgi:Xaa-Pro aminopeptidase
MQHSVEKLAQLRALMKENLIDAYIIPDTDPNMDEYVPDHWRIIAWLTGFTGSSATVVVTDSFAGLWTDSRYVVQAEGQLTGSGFSLVRQVSYEKNSFISWISENMQEGSTIGFNGNILSMMRYRKLKQAAREKSFSLNAECDLISELWKDRPALPSAMAFELDVLFCGRERLQKLNDVRAKMAEMKVDYHLLTSPDDIMWLLNIRGRDIKYSPLLLSFAIIGMEQMLLFAEEGKIPLKVARDLDKAGIVMLPYEEAAGMVTTLEPGSSLLVTPATTSAALFLAIPEKIKVVEDVSIPTRLKAVKNVTEIENIGKAMLKDGVALTKFFHWIEINAGSVPMSELSLTEKLNHIRAGQENFVCLSFSTIMAWNDHAALPHYNPSASSDAVIGQEGLLLVDSGSHYLEGTTDITRTVATGKPSEKQKKDFTLVLKGLISLSNAVFPEGTTGTQLDILARKALWENGINYGHGTGHGVGFCLNVHEGPENIGPSAASGAKSPVLPGMLISDEPGVYRQGEYGIRTENLILCYEHEETESGKFLRFETMSLCYIDKNLINVALLDQAEVSWLDKYHSDVYEKLSPFLTPEEKLWLKEKTDPLQIH